MALGNRLDLDTLTVRVGSCFSAQKVHKYCPRETRGANSHTQYGL